MTNCEPPFPKELEHVLLQSFGGGGEVGGEDAALVMVTNASSIAMILPHQGGRVGSEITNTGGRVGRQMGCGDTVLCAVC